MKYNKIIINKYVALLDNENQNAEIGQRKGKKRTNVFLARVLHSSPIMQCSAGLSIAATPHTAMLEAIISKAVVTLRGVAWCLMVIYLKRIMSLPIFYLECKTNTNTSQGKKEEENLADITEAGKNAFCTSSYLRRIPRFM